MNNAVSLNSAIVVVVLTALFAVLLLLSVLLPFSPQIPDFCPRFGHVAVLVNVTLESLEARFQNLLPYACS
jgi:hypothetical protein